MRTARTAEQRAPLGFDAESQSGRIPTDSETADPGLLTKPRNPDGFVRFAWLVLIYTLAAVAWGVFVRAGRYGDGCGSHWPLCDGSHEPLRGDVSRWVEASHRISTAICGPLALALTVWAFRLFPRGSVVRKATLGALFMVGFEGLIGAALVRYKLVVDNDTAVRAGVMALHALSTFALVGFLGAALYAALWKKEPSLRGQGPTLGILGMGMVGIAMLGVSGSISALGHQLRPVDHVLQAALNPATFWMVRLQPLHPLIAASVGLYILLIAGLMNHLRPDPRVKLATTWMAGLFAGQLALGLVNIWVKAPIPMQMLHLAMADINFVSLVVVGIAAFSPGIEKVELRPAPTQVPHPTHAGGLGAYIALTKPRVISLLLFTTLASAIAANGAWPGLTVFLALTIGGYMAAGAANTINMVIDRDIDLAMTRTASRPTVTQSISSRNALLFAGALTVGSFAILWGFTTLLAAVMALSGLVFYVVVYTMMLKRRTWQNIVIGGAAGAFPPLVGWAGVTGALPPLALYLFAIIFVWTPVHFWALALLLKDEYAAAGVPMLPVVKGDRATVLQIAAYTGLTCVATLLPWAMPHVGAIYGIAALALNLWLIKMCFELYRNTGRPQASRLFHYSMVYLAALFLALAVDRTVFLRATGASETGERVGKIKERSDDQMSNLSTATTPTDAGLRFARRETHI